MIKKLRRKFIMITMISVVVVLSIIMILINVMNYKKVTEDVDTVLTMLVENNGKFPKPDAMPDNENVQDKDWLRDKNAGYRTPYESKDYSDDDEDDDDVDDDIDEDDMEFRREMYNDYMKKYSTLLRDQRISEETPYETRFFTVLCDSNGSIVKTDTGNIASVGEDDVDTYVTKVAKTGKKRGYYRNFRYAVKNTSEGKFYVFVDCSKQLTTAKSFLLASIYISLAGVLAVFVLVIFFSRLVMKPIADTYAKQKRFITDSSHEIKTPLAVIAANTEVIEMVNGESEWTQSITKQVERLTNLTKSMTALARMDEEGFKLDKTKFNLSDALVDTVATFGVVAEQKDISLTSEIEDGIFYEGDEKLIRQLISILMDNAVKYCDGVIKVSLKKAKGKVKFSVYNTATNLDTKNLDHFFDRFYRADASRNKAIEGFGIGLSSAKSIVDLHQGNISAKSDDGKSIKITAVL